MAAQFIDGATYRGKLAEGIATALNLFGRQKLAALIARVEVSPITGKFDADQVIYELGEFGNVWPESILPDAERAEVVPLRPL